MCWSKLSIISCSTPSIALLLIIITILSGCLSGCRVEECSSSYSRSVQLDAVIIGENQRHCQLLTVYMRCLNETSRRCRGNLKFHTLNTMIRKTLVEFRCARYGDNLDSQSITGGANSTHQCYFLFEPNHRGRVRYCALFGDPHLRTFNGQFQTCRTLGAWPLVDNSYFLVQVTNSPVSLGASAVTKITVIIKSYRHCTSQKRYEATSVDDHLPRSFVDDSINSVTSDTSAIELISITDSHITIHLHHIATAIYIRRVDTYLSVAVRMPEPILHEQTDPDSSQLCMVGCSDYQSIPMHATIAGPDAFARCYHQPIRLNRDIALARCRAANLTDSFLDACVFDQLVTGDHRLVQMSADAQMDIVQLYPPYAKHYATGRDYLQIYDDDNDDDQAFTDCPMASQSSVIASSTVQLRTLSGYYFPLILIVLLSTI